MNSWNRSLVLIFTLLAAVNVFGQSASADDASSSSSVCTFADNSQVSVQYHPETDQKISKGEVWTPGGEPMLLFTDSTLTLEGANIPPGAYRLFVIPAEKAWTLIVNRNVTPGAKYDPQQDVARSPMEMGSLPQPAKRVDLVWGHTAPKQCNLRIYVGKVGAWTDFKQK